MSDAEGAPASATALLELRKISKSEIYPLIDERARRGVAVLVISSELAEVVGICDRVIVMREGHLVGEVGGGSGLAITQENIVALATGAVPAHTPTLH